MPSHRHSDKVLLVTHEASRTGAPKVALLVARSLARMSAVTIVSRRSGPLLDEFADVAPTHVELLYRVRRRLWLFPRLGTVAWVMDLFFAAATLIRHPGDVVYVNSTSAAIYLRPAKWLRRRVVLHVHESRPIAEEFLSKARVRELTGIELVACSPSVHADLCSLTGRIPDNIHLVPSVPDQVEVLARGGVSGSPVTTPVGDLVVGACGSVGRRKGTDLWLEMAHIVRANTRAPVRFAWLGEIADPELAGPAEFVDFLGESDNPYAVMARFAVATLTSRDDPFPLVVLEAMALGVPVVAFDVGGVREQVGNTGILVPPGDVQSFAEAVIQLLDDPEKRGRLGSSARQRALDLYSFDAFVAKIERVVATRL